MHVDTESTTRMKTTPTPVSSPWAHILALALICSQDSPYGFQDDKIRAGDAPFSPSPRGNFMVMDA